MIEFKAPQSYKDEKFTIFLGGSIEMGRSRNWQEILAKHLEKYDVILLNPRRDDFDSSQNQSVNNPYFKEQVNWELDGLDNSDLIIINLEENTLSPISMMEIGLYIKEDKRMIICCPESFWRRGNIEVLVDRYPNNVILLEDFDKLIVSVIEICEKLRGSENENKV